MFAECNGMRLYYEESGKGRPLLMIHGNGEDHTIFNEAVEILNRTYHCYVLDSRNHGQSSSADVLHYSDMADDVLAFLEQKDLRDVICYGFSDGGIIGMLAAMKTDRISDLIVSGANLTPAGVQPLFRAKSMFVSLFRKNAKLDLILNEPHISDADLAKIHARTLVLAGSDDLVTERETIAIADGISGATLKILQGEDHGSYIVHSRKIADIILGWLSNTGN